MEDFSLHIKSEPDEVPFEGPIPLQLKVTYNGDGNVNIYGNDFVDINFQTPPGWTMRKGVTQDHLDGRLPTITLAKGQAFSRTLYLHDYFMTITPGKINLPFTLKIWREGENSQEPVVLKNNYILNVMEANPEYFYTRIKDIHSRIDREESAEKRLELYKSIASLSHPELIPIFLESLLDGEMLVFYSNARNRLVELTEAHGKRRVIIDHLVNHGSRYDSVFFSLWKEGGADLSEKEIIQLCESSSLWVRLFCLENYEGPYNREGVAASLITEIEELNERIRKLGGK